MNDKFDKLQEISRYLNDRESIDMLERLKRSINDKNYYLSFMGQFSAGKSRLINNLLEKDVLPVHTTETTALPTFICYGEEEFAELYYNDGLYEILPIADTLELWQTGNDSKKLSSIENIKLNVNSPLLKSGLVIIDTPGINTIIDSHVNKTENIISNSDRVVYVLGKHLTKSDESFLNMLVNNGIEILFVRTKMDEVRTSEEDLIATVSKERDLLAPMTNDKIFFVSNETSNKYNSNISSLREYISVNISEDIERSIHFNIEKRLMYIAAQQSNKLLDKKEATYIALSANREDYEKKRDELEKSLSSLEKFLHNKKIDLKKKYEQQKEKTLVALINDKTNELEKIKSRINSAGDSFNYSSEIPELVHIALLNIQNRYMASFDTLIRENKNEFIKDIKERINTSTDIPDISELPDNMIESNAQIQRLTNKIYALHDLKESLSKQQEELERLSDKNSEEYEKLIQEAEELRNCIDEIQERLDEYPPYVTRYKIIEGDHTHENNLRRIGYITDWATILIPGTTWAKVGAKVLNVGAKGAKAAKAVNVADKFLDGAKVLTKIANGTKTAKAAKAAKHLKHIDKAIDSVKAVRNLKEFAMQNKYPQEYLNALAMIEDPEYFDESVFTPEIHSETKPNILDYLGLDYWFGKIGKKYDTPDVKVIDDEYRSKYIAGKRAIENELRKQADREWKIISESEKFRSEQEKLKRKNEIYAKKELVATEQIAYLEKQVEAEKRKEISKATKKHYSNAAENRIDRFIDHLKIEVQPQIDNRMEDYINLYDFNIGKDIQAKRKQLENVNKSYDLSDYSNLEKELENISNYCVYLESFAKE